MKTALFILALALVFARPAAADSNTVTLTQCFDEVLAHNDELLSLRQDIERAAGTKLVLRSRDLAQIGAESDFGVRGGQLYGKFGPFAIVTVQFTQPVANTGIPAVWRRGQSEVVVAEQNFNVAVSEQLHEVRTNYLRAQRLEQLIGLYEEIIQRLQANVTNEQQRREIGTSGPRPVLQAKVQVLATQADLTAFRRDAFEVRTRLAEAMGRSMDKLPIVSGELLHEPVSLDWPKEAQLAVQRRADLKLLRALIESATEDQRIVKAGYYPYVSLIGSGLYIPGKKRISVVTPIIQGQTSLGSEYRYGGNLTWQIIDNGAVTGASRQLGAVREEYALSLKQLEDDIPRELARIGNAVEYANSQIGALKESVAASEEQLRLVQSRIDVGQATQLDFSDSQRNLLAVRRGMVDALFFYNSALADLDALTGRYLEFAELPSGR